MSTLCLTSPATSEYSTIFLFHYVKKGDRAWQGSLIRMAVLSLGHTLGEQALRACYNKSIVKSTHKYNVIFIVMGGKLKQNCYIMHQLID